MSAQPLSANPSDALEQPVYCLLLASKEQYLTCHVRLADSPERLSAIRHGAQYYSLFRPIPAADRLLELVVKLGHRHHNTAITQSAQGYLVWVHEQDAVLAAPEGRSPRILPTFPAAHCLILTQTTPQQPCYLRVPDLSEQIAGIAVNVQQQPRLYSLLRQNASLAKLLEVGAELTRWGEEIAVLPTKAGYALCVLERAAVKAG